MTYDDMDDREMEQFELRRLMRGAARTNTHAAFDSPVYRAAVTIARNADDGTRWREPYLLGMAPTMDEREEKNIRDAYGPQPDAPGPITQRETWQEKARIAQEQQREWRDHLGESSNVQSGTGTTPDDFDELLDFDELQGLPNPDSEVTAILQEWADDEKPEMHRGYGPVRETTRDDRIDDARNDAAINSFHEAVETTQKTHPIRSLFGGQDYIESEAVAIDKGRQPRPNEALLGTTFRERVDALTKELRRLDPTPSFHCSGEPLSFSERVAAIAERLEKDRSTKRHDRDQEQDQDRGIDRW